MVNRADQTIEENPRLLRPLQALGSTLAALVLAFVLLLASFTTDFVTLHSRLALLLMPVALGLVPVLPFGAFVRRRTWHARRSLRVILGVYVGALLVAGGVLNNRGFGIMGPPVAPPLAAPSATPSAATKAAPSPDRD